MLHNDGGAGEIESERDQSFFYFETFQPHPRSLHSSLAYVYSTKKKLPAIFKTLLSFHGISFSRLFKFNKISKHDKVETRLVKKISLGFDNTRSQKRPCVTLDPTSLPSQFEINYGHTGGSSLDATKKRAEKITRRQRLAERKKVGERAAILRNEERGTWRQGGNRER